MIPAAFDVPGQQVLFENDYCLFLQKEEPTLHGSGIIVTKAPRQTVFDLTREEWNACYELLQQAKAYLDEHYAPDGYNVGWNCGAAAGQDIDHVHMHVIPRFADEPMAGKGIRYAIKQPANRQGRAE